MTEVLVLVDHDRGSVDEATFEALTLAAGLAVGQVAAVVMGAVGDTSGLADHGAEKVYVVDHELLSDYGPEAWGEALRQVVAHRIPVAVLAAGTDRGNEVMAHLAARSDLPMVANCVEITPGDPWEIVRTRWGGSLLESATLAADVKLVTVTPHAVTPEQVGGREAEIETVSVDLDESLRRTVVIDRAAAERGITLTTAPVVVAGGRGVGSPEGFAVLEELAALLGGAVGCSRVATNNGWRPHSDQVGQTGTRIAPDLYIACGVSGAVQHWVGCMSSKKILAINTDREANMVAKADYAVIGDLHEVLPAIVDLVRAIEA